MLFDILAIGGYTCIKRFWRGYFRMRFRREGSFADYLLFFYIKKVIQIRFPICIIADQERPVVDSIVIYGFFAFKIGIANCVSYRYHPFCASLSPCVCRAGLYAADAPAPAANAEADRCLACHAHRAGRDLCGRMGGQAPCGCEKLGYAKVALELLKAVDLFAGLCHNEK